MPESDDELLTVEQVAAVLRVEDETVRRWLRAGRIESIKPSRRRLVRRSELNRFLADATTPRAAS